MNKKIELKDQPASEFDRKGYNVAYYQKRKEDEALYYSRLQLKKTDLLVDFLANDQDADKMDLLHIIEKISETHVDKVIEVLQKIDYPSIDFLLNLIKNTREEIRKDIFKKDKPKENNELSKEE